MVRFLWLGNLDTPTTCRTTGCQVLEALKADSAVQANRTGFRDWVREAPPALIAVGAMGLGAKDRTQAKSTGMSPLFRLSVDLVEAEIKAPVVIRGVGREAEPF
ncbi:MAG: hypothetical protein C4547_05950 [Phycisphaerales bacterium]|nr:MAG: hypothetical protein C4547_05950 [Phycisphaerales bacterium]